MSELTREEEIKAEINKAENEKAEIKTFLAEAIKIKDEKNTDKLLYERLNTIDVRINMLLQHLENEHERQFQRNIATESKVFILIN
jgi:DNA topoisomerase VI subunit B